MEKENVFTITNSEGKEVEAKILFTHHSEEFGHDYVVFLPSDTDQYTAAYYSEGDIENGGELSPIETDEEWEMLEQLLEEFLGEDEEEDAE